MLKKGMIFNGMKAIKRMGAVALGMALFLVGCTKDISDQPGRGDPSDSKVDPENAFDFATTHETQLNISYDVPSGYQVKFEVYGENPISLNKNKDFVKDTTLVPYIKGITDTNGKAKILWQNKPDIVTEVYVYSPNLGVPRVVHAQADGGTIEVSDASDRIVVRGAQPLTRSGYASGSYYSAWPLQDVAYVQPLGEWDESGRPNYLLPEKIEVSPAVQRIIDATLPEGGDLNPNGYIREYLHISEEANVDLYFYSHNSGRQNVLAYYTYEGDGSNIPDIRYINQHLILLFPNLYNTLSQGEGVRLKYYDGEKFSDTFPANTNIGWVLLVDAYQNGSVKTRNINAVYSPLKGNQYNMSNTVMANRPHFGMFTADDAFVLAIEDQPWGTAKGATGGNVTDSYPADMRDDIFIVSANPIRALPDDFPSGTDPEDPDPDLPGFEINTPNGVLAFEDLWPNKGDYDMNDVVVQYSVTDYMNYEYDITGFEGTFTFTHDGARYVNGFGFEVNTTADNIRYCQVESTYKCDGQGLDPHADKAMIMLFDNGKKVPLGTKFHVKVIYDRPVLAWGYKYAPYNPFIITNCESLLQGSRNEVHLSKNYAPTEKADASLLGTGDDFSDVAKGIYYISDNNYPFAINLPDGKDFIGASESSPIDKMYPDFIEWYQSGGQTNTDWYQHPVH